LREKKKGERWGQNGIKKKWDYKYPILSLFQKPAGKKTSKREGIFRFYSSKMRGKNTKA
jgi:hypothetical protein